MLAQFLFLKGDVEGSATLFDQIDRRAPENFRRTAPRKETVITARLSQYSGMIESINLNPAIGGCAEWPNRRMRLLWEQI
jgi:hypothetical protein